MRSALQETVDLVGQVVLGKERQIKLAVAYLLSEGNLLIEDMPGMGKNHPGLCAWKGIQPFLQPHPFHERHFAR